MSILVLPRQWGVVIRCDAEGCEARHATACTGKARNRAIARAGGWGRVPMPGRRGHGDACPECLAKLQTALAARRVARELVRDSQRLSAVLDAAPSVAHVAETFGLAPSTIRRWMRRHVAGYRGAR